MSQPLNWYFLICYILSVFTGAAAVLCALFVWVNEFDWPGKGGMLLVLLLSGLIFFFGGIVSIIELYNPLSQRFRPNTVSYAFSGVFAFISGIYIIILRYNGSTIGMSDDDAPSYLRGVLSCILGMFTIWTSGVDNTISVLLEDFTMPPILENTLRHPVLSQLCFPVLCGAFTITGAVIGTSNYTTLFNILAGVSALIQMFLTSATAMSMLGEGRQSDTSRLPVAYPAHDLDSDGAVAGESIITMPEHNRNLLSPESPVSGGQWEDVFSDTED